MICFFFDLCDIRRSGGILIVETMRQWPKSPYGWSKLMLEQVLASYGWRTTKVCRAPLFQRGRSNGETRRTSRARVAFGS